MPRPPLLALTLLGISSAFVAPRVAKACSVDCSGTVLAPAQGATDVPLNAEIRTVGLREPVLTRGRQVVPTTVRTAGRFQVLTPLAPLESLTAYTVTDSDSVFSTFTTGTSIDTGAPVLSAAPPSTASGRNPLLDFSSCSDFVFEWHEVVHQVTDDVTAPQQLVYLGFVGATPESIDTTTPTVQTVGRLSLEESNYCGARSTLPGLMRMASLAARVAVVDLAGNRSELGPAVQLKGVGCNAGAGAPLAFLGLLTALPRRRRLW